MQTLSAFICQLLENKVKLYSPSGTFYQEGAIIKPAEQNQEGLCADRQAELRFMNSPGVCSPLSQITARDITHQSGGIRPQH